MKTKKNWFVIVAAMIMSSVMIFASCSSDDDPTLPEVIESEVLDEGMDDTASSKPSINPNGVTTGTQFSYKSWIMVKGQTRAAFENKVEVTLNNVFANTDTIITVSNFDLGDYKTVVSKRKRSERQEGFVTVSDSVMVYSVQFAEFSFDYELDFEHAVYNDGVTKQNMPYHQIGAIKDNGYKLEELDFVIEKEVNGQQSVYLRKLLRHSISVAFNGKTYDLSAKVELRKFVGYHPCAISSEVQNSGISNVVDGTWSGTYTSWLEVKHVYSDGKTAVKKYEVTNMIGEIEYDMLSYKILPSADVKLERSGFEGVAVRDTIGMPDKSVIIEKTRIYVVQYNLFTLSYPVKEYEAYYNDGLLKADYPKLEYGDMKVEYNVRYVSEYVGEERNYKEYYFTQKVSGKFGSSHHTTDQGCQIIVYTE